MSGGGVWHGPAAVLEGDALRQLALALHQRPWTFDGDRERGRGRHSDREIVRPPTAHVSERARSSASRTLGSAHAASSRSSPRRQRRSVAEVMTPMVPRVPRSACMRSGPVALVRGDSRCDLGAVRQYRAQARARRGEASPRRRSLRRSWCRQQRADGARARREGSGAKRKAALVQERVERFRDHSCLHGHEQRGFVQMKHVPHARQIERERRRAHADGDSGLTAHTHHVGDLGRRAGSCPQPSVLLRDMLLPDGRRQPIGVKKIGDHQRIRLAWLGSPIIAPSFPGS